MFLRRLAIFLACSAAVFAQGVPIDPSMYSGLRWRLLGPFRAGRVTSVSGPVADPSVYYMGTPIGGVWKTIDAGRTWKPISDTLAASSIGAVAVAPSNANIVYAGTGEMMTGEGVFRSNDAGATWNYAGLKETPYINGIVVDPKNPDLVIVAASGGSTAGPDRGIYRTTNGGRNWSKVLFRDNDFGAIDIAAAAGNARLLIAVLTRRPASPPQQQPTDPAEPGSVIYKSTDEGASWQPVGTNGLPAERWGRVGVSIAAGGRRMFAILNQGLFRSDDAGNTWRRITTDPRVIGSSYFSRVYVDPKNPETVYVAQTSMYRSRDGGVTFQAWNGAPSGDDVHVLWINPADPRYMILGIDQGATVSVNGGQSWSEWFNQATGQFYYVSTDNQFPYRVYASQQDSGTVATISRSDYGEITYRDWFSVGAMEFAHILPDPADPNYVYASGWYSTLVRFNRTTGQFVHVFVPGVKDRITTSTPMAFLPDNPKTLLLGAQRVMETSDGGRTWQTISPDLTRGLPSAAERGRRRGGGRPFINVITPSAAAHGVIWVGTGDGLVHLTRDSGATWENVSPTQQSSDISPAEKPTDVDQWFASGSIAAIDAGHHDPGTAYIVIQHFGDPHPFLLRTHDAGQSWQSITQGLPMGVAWVVREDPERKGLLYAGVDHGVFVSFDDGDHWQPLQMNLPVTQVRDITVHDNDIVIATYGRALWVLDDVSSLRQLGPQVANASTYLFKPAVATRARWDVNNDTPLPPETPAAANPPEGAVIDYFLKTAAKGEMTLEIRDAGGNLVRRFTTTPEPPPPQPANAPDYWFRPDPSLSRSAGLNRFTWDLRYPHPPALTYGYFGAHLDYYEYTLPDHAIPGDTPRYQPQGPLAAPGNYEVVLTVDGKSYKQPLKVVPDPRVHISQADYDAMLALELTAGRGMAASYDAWNQVHAARQALLAQKAKLGSGSQKTAADAIDALDKQLRALEDGNRGAPGFGPMNRDLGRVAGMAGTGDARPATSLQAAATEQCSILDQALERWRNLNATDIMAFNASAQQNGLATLPVASNVPPGCAAK